MCSDHSVIAHQAAAIRHQAAVHDRPLSGGSVECCAIGSQRGSGLAIHHALVAPLSPIHSAVAVRRANLSSPFLLSVLNLVEFISIFARLGWFRREWNVGL